jgi:kumamolisin
MAALVARLNQAKRKNVGFLNPFLYANVAKGVVYDVTSGTNAIKNTIKGYAAGPGWDACTGLGTPDGKAILSTWREELAAKSSQIAPGRSHE